MTGKPFYFLVALWGERYRDRFARYFLPSLLAPGNLRCLRAEDGHRFLIATTRTDWAAIERLPIMAELRRYVLPVLVEIPEDGASNYTATLHRQTRCLKQLFEAAYPSRPYGCLLLPDLIVSDGFVATLIRSASAGYRLVLLPALRQIEEAVLDELTDSGLLSAAASHSTRPLVLAPRRVADLALRHLHPEVAVFEEGHPCQPLYPPFRFWRVPQRNGIMLHGFFGLPILMDFAVVPTDHADCLNYEDYESVYLGRNFSHCGGLHVVQDSDECGILSLTEKSVNRSASRRIKRFGAGWMPQLALLANLRQTLSRYVCPHCDLVRRDLFGAPVRWHGDDLDEQYTNEQARIAALIARAAGDYYADPDAFPSCPSLDMRYLPLDLIGMVQSIVRVLRGGGVAALGVLTGNREDANLIWRKISVLLSKLN